MRFPTCILMAAALTCLALPTDLCAQAPGQGASPGGPGGGPFDPMRMPAMSVLDANGDGELSAEEIGGAAEALKRLDKDQDGKLAREELRPPMAGRGGSGGRGSGGRGGPAAAPAGR